jgi:hypothetical protein
VHSAASLDVIPQRAGAVAHAAHGHGYERHRPEETVLYQVVEQHWPAFRERAEHAGGLPRFVVREMDEYLRCGRLEFGKTVTY